ncbi:translation elongation factor Ts [Patescibacteria group bacterium]
MISAEKIKNLRQKTGISVMECKSALEKAGGDEEKAIQALEELGKERAIKKSQRETKQGLIESYIHNNGKVGVLLSLHCETDFVARNEEFKGLAHDLSMHIAAMDPENMDELLSQTFIKDSGKTIKDLLTDVVAKIGENIKIEKFARYEI